MKPARPPRGASLLRAVENLGLRALESRGFQRRYVPTRHGRVHLLDAPGTGTGPPLLLVHGLGSASIDLSPLMLRLRSNTRRLIVPDLPGHGWSEMHGVPGRMELHEAVCEALETLVDEPVVVIGNSLGGFVAVRWALARPQHVAGLVLLSPGGAPDEGGELEGLLRSFELGDQADALGFIDRVLADRPAPWLRWARAWGVRHRLRGAGPRAILQGASPEHLLSPSEVAGLVSPLLVVWGQQDDVLPDSHRQFWRSNLPVHAVMEEPAGFGHSPYLDDPDLLVRRVRSFLAGLGG